MHGVHVEAALVAEQAGVDDRVFPRAARLERERTTCVPRRSGVSGGPANIAKHASAIDRALTGHGRVEVADEREVVARGRRRTAERDEEVLQAYRHVSLCDLRAWMPRPTEKMSW